MDTRPLVIFLMGSTGTGKTALALDLADRLPVSLISVDAAQVYRLLDVGSAKLPASVRRQYPHDLIDVADVTEVYSAARFCAEVIPCIHRAIAQKKLPVLVGGSMFYFSALRNGLDKLPPRNEALRAELSASLSPKELHITLKQVAPAWAERFHPNDHQRLLRALEIQYQRDRNERSVAIHPFVFEESYRLLSYGLHYSDKLVLWQRLADRLDSMCANGLIQEVEKLRQLPGVHEGLPAMKMIGYRQFYAYLSGKMDYFVAKYKVLCASRQLAKRQMTWLRRWPGLRWLPAEDSATALDTMVEDIVKHSAGTLN